jgi:spore maturation protein CgeB
VILREENRRVLATRDPALLAAIAGAEVPPSHVLTRSDNGAPLLTIAGVPLQHRGDPEQDGVRWARGAAARLEAGAATRAVVVGFGLGYHVEALAARFPGTILVVEPDLAVWRLALASRDLAALLARITIVSSDDDAAATGASDAGDAHATGERTRVLGYAPALLVPGDRYRRALTTWQSSATRLGVRLKILVVSPMYGGSWPIAGYAARALTGLGHETHLLDLSSFHDGFRALERFGARRTRRSALEGRYCDVLGAGIGAAVEALEPDVVLALAQAPLSAAALDEIGASGALRVLWFVEDFRLLTYWREVAAHYDHVFTIQDGECLDAIGAVTDARVEYLPCGFDPEIHRPLGLGPPERAAYGSDVGFVGAGYRNRRLAFRRFLDSDFRIWGSDWTGAEDFARVIQRGGARINTEESVRIFNATSVNLNLHSSTYHDGVDPRGDFVNPRTFELAGCGAFQVVDRRALLPPLFGARELAIADSVGEMREITRHYLAHPEERIPMAGRARRRALAEHTYRHRLERLLGTVVGREQDRVLARPRAATVGDVVRTHGDGALGRFLARFDPTTPFTLDRVAGSIAEREGALEEPEAIFLFLHQFDDMYLREHRA